MSYDRGFLAAAKSLIDERIKLYGANSSPTMLHEILGSMNKLNAVIHNIKEYFIGDINSANSFLEAYCHAEVSREISNISRKTPFWRNCKVSLRCIFSVGIEIDRTLELAIILPTISV